MAINTSAVLMSIMFTSLFISSFTIAYFSNEMYGVTSDAIALPSGLPSYTLSEKQDYTSSTGYNQSSIDFLGNWEQVVGIGYTLVSNILLTDTSAIYVNQLVPTSDNIITNTYVINNTNGEDYSVILNYDASNAISQNKIYVKEDGFHIPAAYFYILNPSSWGADKAFISYPNANSIKDVVITTMFNTETRSVTFSFNGEAFSASNLNEEKKPLAIYYPTYGGVTTKSVGFTLVSFESNNEISSSVYKQTAVDTLAQVSSLVVSMLSVLVWGLKDSIMPTFLQVLLIKTQEAVLLISIAAFIRSG